MRAGIGVAVLAGASFHECLSRLALWYGRTLQYRFPWVSVPLGRFTCNWEYLRVSHTHGTCVQFGVSHPLPSDSRDSNWGLNCSWYHGCSEPKHWLRSCMPLRVFVLIIVSCVAAAWAVHFSHCLPALEGGVGVENAVCSNVVR